MVIRASFLIIGCTTFLSACQTTTAGQEIYTKPTPKPIVATVQPAVVKAAAKPKTTATKSSSSSTSAPASTQSTGFVITDAPEYTGEGRQTGAVDVKLY